MANLTAGVQRIGTYIGQTPFLCTGSVFAVGTTRISTLNASGSPISWRNGSTFNNLPGNNKDQILPGHAFILNPSSAITTDDTLFVFNAAIQTGSNTPANSNWLM